MKHLLLLLGIIKIILHFTMTYGIVIFLYGFLVFVCIDGGKIATMAALLPFVPFILMALYYCVTDTQSDSKPSADRNDFGYSYKYEYRYGSQYPNDHKH